MISTSAERARRSTRRRKIERMIVKTQTRAAAALRSWSKRSNARRQVSWVRSSASAALPVRRRAARGRPGARARPPRTGGHGRGWPDPVWSLITRRASAGGAPAPRRPAARTTTYRDTPAGRFVPGADLPDGPVDRVGPVRYRARHGQITLLARG